MKKLVLYIFLCTFLFVYGCNMRRSFPITIESNPLSAVVYIDGEYKGETLLNVELKTEKYDITLLKEGFIALKEKITVNKENLSFSFALKDIPVKETLPFSGSINSTVSSNQRLIIAESVAGDTKLHCIDTLSNKELWRYTIEGMPDISLKIIDNLLFAFSGTCPPSLYVLNINGKLLHSYKNVPFDFAENYFDKEVAVAYDFSSKDPGATSIWCYSLNSQKVIWREDIKVKDAILLPLNSHSNFIYLFGMNGNFVTLYKLSKLDGETILKCNFAQIHGFTEPATGRIFPTILGTFQDKALLLSDNSKLYCIDQNLGTIYFSMDTGIQITDWKLIEKYLFVSSNASNKMFSIDLEDGKITGIYNTSFSNLPEYIGSQIAYDAKNRKVFVFNTYGKIQLYNIEGKEFSFNYDPFVPFSDKKLDYTSLKIANGILFVEIHWATPAKNEMETIAYDTKTLEPILSTYYEIYVEDNCVFYRSPSENMLIFVDVGNIK